MTPTSPTPSPLTPSPLTPTPLTRSTVASLAAAGALAPVDIQLARTLLRLAGESDERVALGVAAASRGVRAGHVCADLTALGGEPVRDDDGQPVAALRWPDAAEWRASLVDSQVVGGPDEGTPLVLDTAGRLYLRRYWGWQSDLAGMLRRRALAPADAVDGALLKQGLDQLFTGPPPGSTHDMQRIAALLVVLRRFCVISGGPGTGKTSTVVNILALLVAQALARGEAPPSILLVAPTGKAAARLVASIRKAKGSLDVPDAVRDAIPEEAKTVHRALGVIGGRTTQFRHDASRPLAADVVLVDEASMVDLALMTRLVAAVPPRARLVLLGDKDQLASVEAGAVLGDLCNAGEPWAWSRALAAQVSALTGDTIPLSPESPDLPTVGDALVQLTHSYRFGPDSGIAVVARAVNDGQADAALVALEAEEFPDVLTRPAPPRVGLGADLRDRVVASFRAVLAASDPATRLEAFDGFRVLCAHRQGAEGVTGLNQKIERALERAGLLAPRGEWYLNRPIMVLENDYQVGLFNGDTGMILDVDGERRAVFVSADGSIRRVATARLPRHETVFAMTVHKSQGSEFEHVALVLPGRVSPVLTRELVYTGVTRARASVVVYGSPAVMSAAVRAQVQRASGLRDLLWDPGAAGVGA
jgi:exodeoxyribonuclease V alpha subunit